MSFFLDFFLAGEISLKNLFSSMKLNTRGVKVWMEGMMSQIFSIGHGFCFVILKSLIEWYF